ncbi:hypothetical protein [Psychrobacter sanguinis]|uniref:hypothetical protein n=1 Tax=Psychrobacter sanguinis TaxID=861445 RepID=UPI00020C7E22|nr:hypothetical protein [Psychrobacter sanguinis]EGK13525.1 hypothetical protein HMPREF9373_1240 [Psychrobacter sp. 1501(2011)]MCC3345844.1 hypothetical protein [Psychrobacter sanguinis]MCD9150372.1 hypothetical protein [Psychrobacter sanguinis]MDY3305917.1 hypothetical protein [Psychrobacter sanguinis]
MITSYPPQKRPSWRGVLAGLLMGLIVVMAMIALALVLSSFLPFSLQGTSIAAGIYTAITALVSAYVAGYFAVKYSAPETLFGDGTEIDPKDATLTGMLAAASMIALTTVMAVNGATGILSSATNAVGSTVSTVANTTATAAGGVATAVGTAAGQSDTNVQQEAKNVYDKVVGDISRSDVEKWVAKNSQNLDQEQVNATTTVITQLVNEQKAEVKSLDFTDLDTWKNLDEIAKKRLADVQQTLESDEIITRLQTAGLSEPEAQQVRTEVVASYNEYKAQTEQMVASASEKANQALYQAEDVARKTALYTGLFWLISSLLTFLASIAGARSAAANYRLDKPIVTLGDNVR